MSVIPNRVIYAPSAYMARGIENILISAKDQNCESIAGKVSWLVQCLCAKGLGFFVFPIILACEGVPELFFLGKALVLYGVGSKSAGEDLAFTADRLAKLFLGVLCTFLALLAADAVSYLFLQRASSDLEILPFGVEKIYGVQNLQEPIRYPTTIEEVQKAVTYAKDNGKKISIIGTGMSQGRQTVPYSTDGALVLNLSKMQEVKFPEDGTNNLLEVQPGATWEMVQLEANKKAKSVLVKQASDLFSVGGSIGINCHGWEHNSGAISSTVTSLQVVDAEGNLRTLRKDSKDEEEREFFNSMFGTLGYFGVIVGITLKLTDNVYLEEKLQEVSLEEFPTYYEKNLKNNLDAPLLMGRLNINKPFFDKVYVNTFEKVPTKLNPTITPRFELEADRGDRISRIFLDALGHLPKPLYEGLCNVYWKREVDIMRDGHRCSTRNDIMHFQLKSFFQIHQSDLYTQWLQEYFIAPENLPDFLKFLKETLEENEVRLLNGSIRPTPKDEVSILPYAEKERLSVVISFHQLKTQKEIQKTTQWILKVQDYLLKHGDKWYQAYMPFATQDEFIRCYGEQNVQKLRENKAKFDPENRFSNAHTSQYFDDSNLNPL